MSLTSEMRGQQSQGFPRGHLLEHPLHLQQRFCRTRSIHWGLVAVYVGITTCYDRGSMTGEFASNLKTGDFCETLECCSQSREERSPLHWPISQSAEDSCPSLNCSPAHQGSLAVAC